MSVLLFACSASADNLVFNGDFSQGTAGFSTDYTQGVGGPDSLWNPGTFDIAQSVGDLHSLWTQTLSVDLNPFMLVNGRTDASSLVWGQTIQTTPGQQYGFRVAAVNLCCRPNVGGDQFPPLLQFLINGNIFAMGLTDGPGHWDILSGFFTAQSPQTTLSIEDTSTAYGGNDFGIDGISVEPVPEPASLVLLGTALCGCVWRKRRV